MDAAARAELVECELSSLADPLREALHEAAHLLPDQAPMRVFIHHNTLHAFQHLHFHDAVLRGKQVYGGEPYPLEARFRRELARGRIRSEDLEAALDDQYPETSSEDLLPGLSERNLRRLMMQHALHEAGSAELRWLRSERRLTGALRSDLSAAARRSVLAVEAHPRARERRPETSEAEAAEALWKECLARTERLELKAAASQEKVLLHRDLLLTLTGEDAFDLLFPVLIRLSAAYLDDGVAHWPMPSRELGFYRAVRELACLDSSPTGGLVTDARRAFARQREQGKTALSVTLEILRELGLCADTVGPYVTTLLLTLPGWAGMINRLERHSEDRADTAPYASLLEFLAVRLTYEQAALLQIARRGLASKKTLARLYREHVERAREGSRPRAPELSAHLLFQVAQLAGISAARLAAVSTSEIERLLSAIDRFDSLTRRRVFQEAYEHHHRVEVLSALAVQRPHAQLTPSPSPPRFQLICCFDEREESFRRHIEEVATDAQTFGAPGFFGAAMRFRGIDETQHVPLAPVVISPTHLIEERPRDSDFAMHKIRLQRRQRWARLGTQLSRGTRSLSRGMLLNAAFGILALFPLLMRLLSPRLSGRLRSAMSERFLPSPRTELTVHHDDASDLPQGVKQRGFTADERVLRVATVLENIGLVRSFSRLILVLGHGSSTLNNPHKSAYDCGACGGRQGGPNARVFCQMANDPHVRAALAERGILIPEDTWFVGGQHDTCEDEIHLLDVQTCPDSHQRLFREVVLDLDKARAHNAQERCRRLFSAPDAPSPQEALRHVEGRSEHLAEPRPEFGHATNAVAVIGRRGLTRGLFMDRRAFLLSYDPTIDTDGRILERTLAAATPVGAGINLEYYFSHVDNEVYGAGSKLPHNITGLFGVMSGHASDLRTGLPRQMIEIHEPLRLLVIVEATTQRLLEIASRQAEVKELVVNRWIQLVSLDPETGAMHVFTDRGFVPFQATGKTLPEAASSAAFYRGQREFLPPARLVPIPVRSALAREKLSAERAAP